MTENFLKLFKISMMASCLVLAVGFLTIPDKKAENGETTNKSQEETYGVLEVSVSLEHEDITYRLVDSSWNKSKEIKNDYIEQSYLEIEWINNTDDVLMYPMSYAISKDGTYFQIKTDHGFYDAFECIMPGESKKEKYYPNLSVRISIIYKNIIF